MEDAGGYRVAFPRRWWYPVCRSSDLAGRPLPVTVMDTPLVVYRDRTGQAAALVDRCPHRNMALSLGRVHADGSLECAYHGWRFDRTGRCTAVPGLDRPGPEPAAASDGTAIPGLDRPAPETTSARDAVAYAACEQDGFVWVWADRGAPPVGTPFALPELGGRSSGQVVLECDLQCTLHAAIENTLDVPHTAYLHRGLFRGDRANPVTATRRPLAGGVEVRYVGEPVAYGHLRLPGPEITFDHWDRFWLPSIAQVEYRVRDWVRIVTTVLHLPVSAFVTRAWFVVAFSSPLPPALVRPIVGQRGRRILAQDARALADQLANIRRFGGERFTSTDLDLIGNAVWRLLREAERAESAPPGPHPAPTPDDDAPGGPGPSVTFRI